MRRVAWSLCALLLPAAPALAQCTPTMVESQPDSTGSWVLIATQMEAAQTFTLGAGEGGTLDSVTVYLSNILDKDPTTGTLTVEIQGVSAGIPDGSALASEGPIPFTQLSAGRSGFRFSTPATVVGGGMYAVVLRVDGYDPSNAAVLTQWAGSLGDAYAGGGAFSRETGAATWDNLSAEVDRHFQIHVCP